MSLQGSFDVLGFADVVNLLAHKRESGRLRIRGPGVATDFFFDAGRLTAADDGEAQPPISEKEARTRVEEAFFEILAHERGTFEFQSGPTTPWTAGLSASVERVLSEANRRLEEWRKNPEHDARLRRDLNEFWSLPPERRAQLRKFDHDLHSEDRPGPIALACGLLWNRRPCKLKAA